MKQAQLIYGVDVVEGLRALEPESVQCVVTSPPYWGLRDYGVSKQLGMETRPEEYILKMLDIFKEVKRVLSKDGSLWLNIGDSYYNNFGGGSSSMTTGNAEAVKRKGRHNKPKHELFKIKDLIGIPWRVAFALQQDGWYLRQDIIWSKPNPMPESVTDRCTKSHEYIFLLTKSEKYFYNSKAIKEPIANSSAVRLSQNVGNQKGSKRAVGKTNGTMKAVGGTELRNKRSVWNIATKPYKGAHFAVFPRELPSLCILAGSRPGDTILDPFSGSGTTGEVACTLGRRYIGIDLNKDYQPLAEERLGIFNLT